MAVGKSFQANRKPVNETAAVAAAAVDFVRVYKHIIASTGRACAESWGDNRIIVQTSLSDSESAQPELAVGIRSWPEIDSSAGVESKLRVSEFWRCG